jgi:hypothetical protein
MSVELISGLGHSVRRIFAKLLFNNICGGNVNYLDIMSAIS